MSADVLREAARLMGGDWGTAHRAEFCQCDESDHWFDRSICPEPCGSMHDICSECGRIKGFCPVAVEAAEDANRLSETWIAVADWLLWLAPFADLPNPAFVVSHGLAVARAYLGDKS